MPSVLLAVAAALLLAVALAPAAARATEANLAPQAGEGEGEGEALLEPGEPGDALEGQGGETEVPGPAPTSRPVAWWLFKCDESGNAVVGARLELRDASGAVLRTLETAEGEEAQEDTLEVGKAYTLHEAAAPAGFALADDVTFRVGLDEDGGAYVVPDGTDEADAKEESLVLMVDERLDPVAVDKRDARGAGLAGARLALWDESSGELVERWTSDGKPHEVAAELLLAGHAYRLVEEGAPEGYERCGEVRFSLDRAGGVAGLAGDAATYDEASRTLVVTDEPTPEEPAEPRDPTPEEPVRPEEPPATPEPEPVTKAPAPAAEPAAAVETASATEPSPSSAELPQTGDAPSPAAPLAALGLAALLAGALALAWGRHRG